VIRSPGKLRVQRLDEAEDKANLDLIRLDLAEGLQFFAWLALAS
jgi:hypothetical protein